MQTIINQTFTELDKHLLESPKPSEYIKELDSMGIFHEEYPFTMLGDLKNVPQNSKYHPEGNVWNHTLMVLDNAAERKHLSKNPRVLMWAALLHDLGKVPTTKVRKGRITSYDHDKVGEKMAIQFLREFTKDEKFITDVSKMVRWHMQILFVNKDLPFADLRKMASEVSIEEIAILGFCDRMGRGGMSPERKEDELKAIKTFLEKCSKTLNINGNFQYRNLTN